MSRPFLPSRVGKLFEKRGGIDDCRVSLPMVHEFIFARLLGKNKRQREYLEVEKVVSGDF